MSNLLKTDLRRVFKDKLFLIICIIAAGFALITPFLYKIIEVIINTALDDAESNELYESMFYSKTLFTSAFSSTNNFGLILPILVGIIICKDFSFGTMRNKIISGNSRKNIYLSLFLTITIIMTVIIVIYALVIFAIGSLLFDYSTQPFTSKDISYMFSTLLFEILSYILIAAILTFYCVSIKSGGLSIVLFVATSLVFSLLGGVLSIISQTITTAGDNNITVSIVNFFSNILPFYGANRIVSSANSYSLDNWLYLTIPPVILAVLLVFLGIITFKKKDLK